MGKLVNDDPALASSYFGRGIVAPADSNSVYVMGRSIVRSTDGGAHFTIIKGSPGGDDYHALWINPTDPTRMITGADQGAVVTVNGGQSWSSWYNQPTGHRYHPAAADPFRQYLGGALAALVGVDAFLPMGVGLALVPTTGLVLPFISYGRSSLIIALVATGLLLNLGTRKRAVVV